MMAMSFGSLLAIVALSLLSASRSAHGQGGNGTIPSDIQGIRLANGTYGSHMGRVEILYNGTWGTICDDFWSLGDARVACRMLGYVDAVCSVQRSRFGGAEESVPILMNNVQCRGTEDALDHCVFDGWQQNTCTHNEDAGVICEEPSVLGVPDDIRLVESSTSTLTIGWTMKSGLPERARSHRFRITYESETDFFSRISIYSLTPDELENITEKELNFTLTRLQRDTEYTISIRAEFRYPFSPFLCTSFVTGNYSEPFIASTNSTLRSSNISVRLVPPQSGSPFMGRLEVFHNNVWGTVCDDRFGTREADVVCGMLNYTEGALCAVRSAGFGRGEGQIWLDDVDCEQSDEVLDDCTFRPWGENNCNHGDDVGVICRSASALPPVENLTISHVSASSITLRWNPYIFPSGVSTTQFQLQYTDFFIFGIPFPFTRTVTVSGSETEYTLTRLQFDREYNITIRPTVRFSQCRFNTLFGPLSDQVSAVTQETAPSGPPTSFHVVVLNSTAVEVLYSLPQFEVRNGVIRGFKIFAEQADGSGNEIVYNITDNTTLSFIAGGLKPATAYIFSILAYTVADGPRSIHLTAITNAIGSESVIVRFGIYGSGLDKETRFTFQRDIHVHCSVSIPDNATVDWFFSNGTKVGNSDRNVREGHFANGTAVLQIASDRLLSYCDAGVYTCAANVSGKTERKNFTLVINVSPPGPSSPTALRVEQDSITIGWDEPECDGGHVLSSFTIEYRELSDPFFFGTRTTLRNINPAFRNFTINNLRPQTIYSVRIRSVSIDGRNSVYSASSEIQTLPPAPSAPRDVSVRLVRPLVIEVRWKVPSVTNGDIIHYTVYAIPLVSVEATRAKRQTDSLSAPKTIKQVFPGTAMAGNVTLKDHSLIYRVRVSAAIMSDQDINEGDLSSFTDDATIFVPKPGLPVPVNVTSPTSTNASVSLRWDYPPPPVEIITGFLITYSARINWRSSRGTLVRFVDHGQAMTSGSRIKISQLIPGTSYLFKVSAITERGRGAEVDLVVQTDRPQSTEDRLAYFQLRIGPISSCTGFMDGAEGNTTERILSVRNGLSQELVHLCPTCRLTPANIKEDELSCRGGLTKQIVYRGRIVGTEVYSATGLISLIQSWVTSGRASLMIQSSRLHVDPTCLASLDSLRSSDCPITFQPITTAGSAPVTKTTQEGKPETATNKPDSQPIPGLSAAARGGEIGGIFVGSLIVILLTVLIVLLALVMLKKWKPSSLLTQRRNGSGHSRMVENDKTPFADIGSSHENDLDSKDNVEKPSTLL